MTIVFSSVFAPPLNGAHVSLGPGMHVVLGTELDGTRELVALAAGAAAPRRGSVRVSDGNPRSAPALRRRIGALFAEEMLPLADTVSAAIGVALSARRDARTPQRLLGEAGLGEWASRPTDSLSAAERRRVALALALSLSEPIALALYEPLVACGSERERLRELLAERAGGGTCVLCTTASPRDAAELAGSILLLERGRFVRRPSEPLALQLAPGTTPSLRVRSPESRRLAAELAKDEAVTSLVCGDESGGDLVVRGSDPEVLSLSIARAAKRAQAPVLALECTLPPLEMVRAASEGLTRAAYEMAQRTAYEAALRSAQPSAFPPPAPPPPFAPPAPSTPAVPSTPPTSSSAPPAPPGSSERPT